MEAGGTIMRRQRCILCAAVAAAWLLSGAAAARAGSLVGSINVKTNPRGAAVYVSGELKGTGPCLIEDVGIGQVEVRAEKRGYATETVTVTVEPDARAEATLTLRELANVGHMLVKVKPDGSEVRLDYVVRGRTPLTIINVDAGTHKLEVSCEGHRPMVTNVVVVTGQERIVTGRLVEGSGFLEAPTGQDLTMPELDPDEVPLPDEMPEEKAFEPVRELLAIREYGQAVELLDQMAQQEENRAYMGRIARDRRLIGQVRPVVEACHEALGKKEGRLYRLELAGGVAVEGTVLGVTEDHVVLDVQGTGEGRPISRGLLAAGAVVKLAGDSFSPGKASNQAVFAVLYAMEGAYQEAYDALRLAAVGGYDIAEARGYVDAERLWAAALEKERELERQRRETERAAAELAASEKENEPPQVLVDRHRGGWIGPKAAEQLKAAGCEVRPVEHSPSDEDLQSADVIVIRDAGPGRPVPSYDAPELRRLVRYVAGGGGLVFFAAARPRPERPRQETNPFAPLLKQFRVAVRPGTFEIADKAPRWHPRNLVLAVPRQRHPVTDGVEEVLFALDSPTIVSGRASWLLTTTRFVRSTATEGGPVPMVVARRVGRGRVVVFASVPRSRDGERAADADRLVLNAVWWAAGKRVAPPARAR